MDNTISLNNIQISASLEEILRLGVVIFRSVSIGEGNAELTTAIEGITGELQRTVGNRRPSTLSIVERTRRLYHSVGLDPTKHRPSSERLLRRVQRQKPFPRVNDFVDAMNLVSLRLQFPLGLYDWDNLVPPVLVRIGRPNETFRGLTGDTVGLGGRIVLVDGEGPFGNPTHDSDRAIITKGTVRPIVVLFAPADIPREELEDGVGEVVRAAEEFCQAQVGVKGVLP